MNETKLTYSVPSPEGRDWFRFDAKASNWVPARIPGSGQAVGYLFAASDCFSIPLWVNSEEPGLIPQLAAFEIERLTGQVILPEGSRLMIRKIARKDSHVLIHATVIGEIESDLLKRNWQKFSVNPMSIAAREGEVHIWSESGRWVVGFFYSNILTHWHCFGESEFSRSHLLEINCLIRDLIIRGIIFKPHTLVIHSEESLDQNLLESVEDVLGLLIIYRDPEAPNRLKFPAIDSNLKPQGLIEFQSQKEKRQRVIMSLVFAACLIVAGFFTAWFQLQKLERELQATEERSAELAPQAARILQARERWESLAPAFETERYPVEIFHRVAMLLPAKGVRLTEFEIRKGKITIRGEASNVPTAIKFKADLENSPLLSTYQWQVPPPQISGDTAKFSAFGVPIFQPIVSNP